MRLDVDGVRSDIQGLRDALIQFLQRGTAAQQVIVLFSQLVSNANVCVQLGAPMRIW